MEEHTSPITNWDMWGKGDTQLFLRLQHLLQPACPGVGQIVTRTQLDLWGQVLDLVGIISKYQVILGASSFKRKEDGKTSWYLHVHTNSGHFEIPNVQKTKEECSDLVGLFVMFHIYDMQPNKGGNYDSDSKFHRLLASLDFLYNILFVFSETRKMVRDNPHGLSGQFSLSQMLAPLRILIHMDLVSLVKLFKWSTTYPLAAVRALKKSVWAEPDDSSRWGPNPLPPVPMVDWEEWTTKGIYDSRDCVVSQVSVDTVVPWYLFRNDLGRRYQSVIKGKASAETIQFAYNIQMSKKGCPEVTEDFVLDALRDHRSTLTKSCPDPSPTDEELMCQSGQTTFMTNYSTVCRSKDEFYLLLEDAIDYLLPALLEGSQVSREKLMKCCPAPSTKACYEKQGVRGGSREFIRDTLIKLGHISLESDFLYRMYETRSEGVKELRTSVCGTDEDIMEDLWERALKKDIPYEERRCKCSVVPIIEPLKVRVITKSEAIPQYLSKAWQQAIHSGLRRLKPFSALDHPLDGTDINDLVQSSRSIEGAWRSGDYKGATDGLDQRVTEIVASKILRFLSPWLTEGELHMLMSNLVNQEIEYPQLDSEPGDTNIQRNGQLMGSILSFPILCVINYMTYFLSVSRLSEGFHVWRLDGKPERDQRSIRRLRNRFRKEPVLINGDDILWKGCNGQYIRWEDNLRYFGFKLSQGKNLCSEKFLMINSQLYINKKTTSPSGDDDFFMGCDYGNLGLLKGRSKVGGQTDTVDLKPLWTIHKDIREGFKTKDFDKLYTTWNRKILDVYSSGGKRNYFGPRELGMCGLYTPSTEFTLPQRCWATALHKQFTEYGDHQWKAPGLRLKEPEFFGVADAWNDCKSKQPNLGVYVPIRQPAPPGYTSEARDKIELHIEVSNHPLHGSISPDNKLVFFNGSEYPKEYVQKPMSSRKIVKLSEGYRFCRRTDTPLPEEVQTSPYREDEDMDLWMIFDDITGEAYFEPRVRTLNLDLETIVGNSS